MHTQDTINQFIEFRARSLPYAQIATQLNVSRCTLLAWGQKYKPEIDALRSVEAEAIRTKYLGTRVQEVSILAQRLQRLENAFDQHNPVYIPVRQLTDMIRLTRDRLEKLCAEPILPKSQTPEADAATNTTTTTTTNASANEPKTRLFPDRRTVANRAFPKKLESSSSDGLVLTFTKIQARKGRVG